jgi:hypothetical protein
MRQPFVNSDSMLSGFDEVRRRPSRWRWLLVVVIVSAAAGSAALFVR